MKRKAWMGTVAAALVVAAGASLFFFRSTNEVKWRKAKVESGNVTQRISATGALSALIQVSVGTQVSGTVMDLFADYNSLVRKGQVIARIDPTIWETQLKDAQASLERAQANYDNAKAEYERNKRLAAVQLVSDQDLDTKATALKTASGTLDSAKASLTRAKINLSYCTITAPVDGVVVSRAVDVGQTVAASFNTPNLFSIAKDLSKMKVEASIDEADIGQVKVGQKAFFTVDAYQDKQFTGFVSEVRLEPIVNQNVVTYKVVMEVANELRDTRSSQEESGHASSGRSQGRRNHDEASEKISPLKPFSESKGKHSAPASESAAGRYIPPGSPVYRGDLALMPGMTANVTIVTQRRENVLRVPSVALRFNPNAFLKEAAQKEDKASRNGQVSGGGTGRTQGGPSNRGVVAKREDRIWVLEKGKPKAISVKAGISDGQFTEVSGEGISEGLEVLTGIEDQKKTPVAASPFGGPGSPGGPGGMPRR